MNMKGKKISDYNAADKYELRLRIASQVCDGISEMLQDLCSDIKKVSVDAGKGKKSKQKKLRKF